MATIEERINNEHVSRFVLYKPKSGLNIKNLKDLMSLGKTIRPKEGAAIYDFICRTPSIKANPVMVELGTYRGLSATTFVILADFAGINLTVHTWDVTKYKAITKFTEERHRRVIPHFENLTNQERETIDKYNPSFVFIDCHWSPLVHGMMQECIRRKLPFILHDIHYEHYELFNGKEPSGYCGGAELYYLGAMFDKSLWSEKPFQKYENNTHKITIIREHKGIAIVEPK